jgi:hypothetical protein
MMLLILLHHLKLQMHCCNHPVAVAVPSAAVISEADGLQPRVAVAPVIVITGGFLSATHVMVLEVVAVLPQASTCSECSCL